jgi:two-component system cell cycle sensor histidine kinase/response regulator CckA
VVIVFSDITEKRRMEDELQRAQKLESIGILAGGIAHDFNNILTAVIGNLSLAKIHARPEDEIYERLNEAGKAASIAKDLTQQLLTFSKGGAPIKKVASIKEILSDTTEFALSGSNVRCRYDIPEDLWSVECDVGQISQVINNLIINAKQAMPAGGTVDLAARNAVVAKRDKLPLADGKYLKIVVRDRGVGIPPEHLSMIFDPYFTTKQRGSGLGLATTYSIVKNHGGYIRVETKEGSGTSFEVYLPSTGKVIMPARRISRGLPSGRGRILLMDDEDVVRKVAGTLLKYLGYEVTIALDGAEMLELYRKARSQGRPFDAVILDLTIPGGMGGKEAVRRLLEIDSKAVAVVSSGYSNDPIMANYRKYGFKGVVAKPYEIDDLGATLQKVLSEEE